MLSHCVPMWQIAILSLLRNSLTVYLDRKHFTLKFSFSYSEAPFSLSPDYREKC